jgi:hypothetical protein
MRQGAAISSIQAADDNNVIAEVSSRTPELEVEAIYRTYAERMRSYQRSYPDAYDALRNSTSLETDGHVRRLLRTFQVAGQPPVDLVDRACSDALFVMRHIWTVVTGDPQQATDILRVLSLGNDDDRERAIQGAFQTKSYLMHHGGCALLTCDVVAERYTTFNSLQYCDTHVGLAIFHGLRHTCDPCQLWYVLALKTHATTGHIHNTLLTLGPLLSNRAVGPLNVVVESFGPSPGYTSDLGAWPDSVPFRRDPHAMYHRTESDIIRFVPKGAFSHHGSRRNGMVEAWFRVWQRSVASDESAVLVQDWDNARELFLSARASGELWHLVSAGYDANKARRT